jgi:hypothetical protein
MVFMATRKSKPQPRGRSRDRGDSAVFTTEFDPALLDALETFASQHRPKTTRRAVLEWMAEEFLTKRGIWPPTGKPEKP